MNLRYLGDQIDIHGGGNDLIFPHHENEIAQTESYTCKPFARYWMHNGMMVLPSASSSQSAVAQGGGEKISNSSQTAATPGEGEKMSKSKGNVVTIDAFLAQHNPDVLRVMIAGSQYRKPLVFSQEVIADNERALARLLTALRPATGGAIDGPAVAELSAQVERTRSAFEAAMDDDFNTAGALASLFELVRAINAARDAGVGGEPFAAAQMEFRALAGVLGLKLEEPKVEGQSVAPFVDLLLEVRADLRKAKQWALADKVRDRLKDLGVIVEDGPQGSTWRMGE
jgi:cysteinyl-tRNA synthetase